MFNWFRRWREARARRQAALLASMLTPADPRVDLNTTKAMVEIVNELSKGRLEVMKFEREIELERMKLDREDRIAEREARRKFKLEASQRTREWQQRKKTATRVGASINAPPALAVEMDHCEDCSAIREHRSPVHNRDMWSHNAHGHPRFLRADSEAKSAATGN